MRSISTNSIRIIFALSIISAPVLAPPHMAFAVAGSGVAATPAPTSTANPAMTPLGPEITLTPGPLATIASTPGPLWTLAPVVPTAAGGTVAPQPLSELCDLSIAELYQMSNALQSRIAAIRKELALVRKWIRYYRDPSRQRGDKSKHIPPSVAAREIERHGKRQELLMRELLISIQSLNAVADAIAANCS